MPPCLSQEEKNTAHVLRVKGTVIPGRRHVSQQAQTPSCFLFAGPRLLSTGKAPGLSLSASPLVRP